MCIRLLKLVVKIRLAGKKAVKGFEECICGGISGSTDLGFVAEILKPKQIEVASFGPIRATNMLAHAADEFVYIEDPGGYDERVGPLSGIFKCEMSITFLFSLTFK